MIRFIVKRDGRKVSFNEDKISNAIRKALISVSFIFPKICIIPITISKNITHTVETYTKFLYSIL